MISAAVIGFVGLSPAVARDPGPIAAWETPTLAKIHVAPPPPGSVYVANGGSDSNPGTLAAPFATIHHALAVVAAGGTVTVRGGTYRESLGAIKHKVTLQAYPGEQPWVKGSVNVDPSTFTSNGGAWSMPFTTKMCDNCFPAGALDPLYPAAGYPEQVFVDGAPLRQVLNKDVLGPGAFYVDRGAGLLWLNDNPNGHMIEVTELPSAFTISPAAAGTVIRGLGFEHWATVYQNGTNVAAASSAPNVTFDGDTFAWSATRALGIYGKNDVVTNSKFLNNGMNGLLVNAVSGFDIENSEIAYSNWEHFSIASTPFAQIAGLKCTSCSYTMIRRDNFHDNLSNALWFDKLSYNQTVVYNQVIHNEGHGITVEVSANSIIAENVVANNGRDGIKISGSNVVEVWNNTSVGNGGAEIGVYEDPRHTTPPPPPTSDTTSVRIGNNIFEDDGSSTTYVFDSLDATHPPHETTLQMISADDHNDFGRTNPVDPLYTFATQASLSKSGHYLTDKDYYLASGRERSSSITDGIPLTVLFTDPANNNYTVQPAAALLLAQPATMPSPVAQALGTGTTPNHIGA
ncbi:MAG TPA: right-handed parallel beta-helix repeat-containing protein [Acidimicrobiia bacterium]